jgi:antitoxin component of RelBE/YafQ-DinJ toxin-antitoxin module
MAKKNVAFKIRVEEELRREFVETCQAGDLTAAQVVRQFMRKYVDTHKKALQGSLFSEETHKDGGVI